MLNVRAMKDILGAIPEVQEYQKVFDRVLAPTPIMIEIGKDHFVDCHMMFVKDPSNPEHQIVSIRIDGMKYETETKSGETKENDSSDMRKTTIGQVEDLIALIKEGEVSNED